MILIDLNVVLDVVQRRDPHYGASAAVMEAVVGGNTEGSLPSHAIPTLHYIIERYNDRQTAQDAVTWLLQHFAIVPVGRPELVRALEMGLRDYEDAIVAAAAQTAQCTAIITRNVRDFRGAPIQALTPTEYLLTA